MEQEKDSIAQPVPPYRPYPHLKWFVLFYVINIAILLLLSLWSILPTPIFLLMLIGLVYCALTDLSIASLTIFADEKGIRIKNCYMRKPIHYQWHRFSYGYYIYNARGRLHILLSPILLKNDVRKAFNKTMRTLWLGSPKLTKDGYLSLLIDVAPKDFKAFIEENVSIVGNPIPFL